MRDKQYAFTACACKAGFDHTPNFLRSVHHPVVGGFLGLDELHLSAQIPQFCSQQLCGQRYTFVVTAASFDVDELFERVQ